LNRVRAICRGTCGCDGPDTPVHDEGATAAAIFRHRGADTAGWPTSLEYHAAHRAVAAARVAQRPVATPDGDLQDEDHHGVEQEEHGDESTRRIGVLGHPQGDPDFQDGVVQLEH